MELLVYEPAIVINMDEISIGDSITFDLAGTQANGYVYEMDLNGLWMKVKYWNHTARKNAETTIQAEEINSINFNMLKWADYGFENIEDRIALATKEVYFPFINRDILPGTAFYYALDGENYTMGLANKVEKTYIDLILKTKMMFRLKLDDILVDAFKCRFSADLDEISYYPINPIYMNVQKFRTVDGRLLLKE